MRDSSLVAVGTFRAIAQEVRDKPHGSAVGVPPFPRSRALAWDSACRQATSAAGIALSEVDRLTRGLSALARVMSHHIVGTCGKGGGPTPKTTC